MKIAFLLYPTERIRVSEDTSFWIMHELRRRGHRIYHFLSESLIWQGGAVRASLRETKTHPQKGFLASPSPKLVDLAGMDCIFIRKEPPFDREYLAALQLLDLLKDKVFVLNDPTGIAMAGEKLFTLEFPKWVPATCVTESPAIALDFIRKVGKAVAKPLHLKSGAGIVVVSPSDRNTPSLLEILTVDGLEKIMLQRFIDTDRYGDKRILVLDGEILGAFARFPGRRDFRANLSRGASLRKAAVTVSDKKLVADLAPELQKRGLYFVGIDVIGKFLTEINVTSPAGIADLKALHRTSPESKVADFLESKVI